MASKYEPATLPEAVMERSNNVASLRPPRAKSPAGQQIRPKPERGLADVLVAGGSLIGLALNVQQLVLALGAG